MDACKDFDDQMLLANPRGKSELFLFYFVNVMRRRGRHNVTRQLFEERADSANTHKSTLTSITCQTVPS